MTSLTKVALALAIIGALNWLLVGLAKFDLVAAIAGTEFGDVNAISALIYVVVGLAALWLIPTLVRWVVPGTSDQSVQRI